MGEIEHKQAVDSITKKWALLAALCISPLFFLFAYLGDPGRGQAACVCATSITIAARIWWDLRTRVWYWATLALIVLLHIPVISLVPWRDRQLTYVAILPAAFADFLVTYGILRFVRHVVEKGDALSQDRRPLQ